MNYGYGCDPCYPGGYAYPVAGINNFALIVVLFILLIIIGAVCYCGR
ncbi:YjcZ family sporulation protein [Bacillus sp. KH172YL63]|nr:YjcZ family sporulation protein [Bacillus sp. KH172YL63]